MSIDWTAIDSVERARALVDAHVPPGSSRSDIAAFLGAGGVRQAFEDEEDGVIRARVDGPSPTPSVVTRWVLEFHLDEAGACREVVVEGMPLAP